MPNDGEKYLYAMVALFPGFISFGLARYITDMGDIGQWEFTMYSFGYSLFNFAIALSIYHSLRWIRGKEKSKTVPSSVPFVLLILVVSILIGIFSASFYEKDTFLRVLRKTPGMRLTTKRSYKRPLPFLLALNRKGQLEEGRHQSMRGGEAWLKVSLASGKVFEGYPEFFPSGNETSEILLSPACKKAENTSASSEIIDIRGPGVLIYEKEIKFIEFIDREESACYNLWEQLRKKKGAR